jgi:phosphoserine phosphatase RsbU/P
MEPALAEARLQDIRALTDAALARLDDQELLTELLDRTRVVLGADTAAVLLLDYSSGQLIATAAAGLEEEVRQGVRIPVGRGFAGRIAAEHRPVILDRVDHTTVLNPILMAKGIRTMMGVPLVARGRVIGVLHVGSVSARAFTSEDVELLQLAADRAAAAVQSMTAQADRIAAAAVQRSLVPAAPPAYPGAELAARFVPGSGVVGGDWYDVFTLPSGELGVVVGDVAGSGLTAAVVMGRMRSALRAYALETRDPADVLARLDRKMQHFEPDAMATVLYAVFERDLGQAHISVAGHLPPVIALPGPASTAGPGASKPDDRRRATCATAGDEPHRAARHAAVLLHRRSGRAPGRTDRCWPGPALPGHRPGLAGGSLRLGNGGPGGQRGVSRRHSPADGPPAAIGGAAARGARPALMFETQAAR